MNKNVMAVIIVNNEFKIEFISTSVYRGYVFVWCWSETHFGRRLWHVQTECLTACRVCFIAMAKIQICKECGRLWYLVNNLIKRWQLKYWCNFDA